MTQIKKFGLGLAVVALFAAMAMATISTAEAAVLSVTRASGSVPAGGTNAITVVVNSVDDVTVTATAGSFLEANAECNGGACTFDSGDGTAAIVIDGAASLVAGNNVIVLEWDAPASVTAAGTVTVTAAQAGSALQTTFSLLGPGSSIEVVALRSAPTGTACGGDTANVIRSGSATMGQQAALLCALVRDSGGNLLSGATVVFTTTAGLINPAADTTGAVTNAGELSAPFDTLPIAAGTGRAFSTLRAATGTAAGTIATVTASTGTVQATTTVSFGGDPASCEITTTPTTVAVGGSANINVAVEDAAGASVPDGITVGVAQVNPGQGTNVAILNPSPTTQNGTATSSAIAAIQGAIAIGATTGTNINCTGTLLATGTVVPPVGETGDGTFVAPPSFGTGNVGSAVFNGGSVADLADAVIDAGGTAVWAQGSNGNWYRYSTGATGATAFVNNAFNTQFADGFTGATAVFVVR